MGVTTACDDHSELDQRRHTLSMLINRFVVQLQTGCGNTECITSTCFTCRTRLLPRQARRYNAVTARAMAAELAVSDNPQKLLCPYISNAQVTTLSTEAQAKIDPKSLMQQLFNTRAFRSFQEEHQILDTSETTTSQKSPSGNLEISEPVQLTCDDMILNKTRLAEAAGVFGRKKLLRSLSNFDVLSHSFYDQPIEIWGPGQQHDLPAVRIDQAFRGWPSGIQGLIFDSLWLSLGPVESSILDSALVATVITSIIHALTASIPRAQRDTWHVVWSTIVNGRAYGKQRNRRSDPYSSPWLHILDAFESEPALRLTQRLVRAIGVRSYIEETPGLPPRGNQIFKRLRAKILDSLIDEERTVRIAKFGSTLRVEKSHGKPLLGTTTLLWLEWLRKCFLKSWDGSFRLSRQEVAGAALELMEDIWHHRCNNDLDLPDDLFPTPIVFNSLNIDKAAVDWMNYHNEPSTRHILSFQFLFSIRGLSLVFRMVNHIHMRRSYCGAGAVQRLRTKAMPRASPRDIAYLDLRLKTTMEPYLVLKINRHSVLSDANDQLWHRLKSELAKPLRVRMGIDEGEIGHDLGGVQIEFFKLACAEALDPNYSLFSVDPQTHLAWFQPASMVPLYKFQLFGILFALAIYNGVTLPVSFPLALYRKLLYQKYDESDLYEGWPQLAKALQTLCDYDGSVEDDLVRDYTFSFMANGLYVETDMKAPWRSPFSDTNLFSSSTFEAGKLKIHRLYPNKHHPERKTGDRYETVTSNAEANSAAESKPPSYDATSFQWPGWEVRLANSSETPPAVTNANRAEYVQEYTRWMLDYSIRPQFSHFAKGFYTVLDSKAFKLLTPETLRNLVEGHKNLDVNLLQRAATYRGYESTSRIIRWFWEIVKKYPEDKQKKLLEFVTASSRVPVNGAESLTFVIEKIPDYTTSLPGSSTCFSTLRLPEYETKEILERKLDIALQHSLGFGQA